MKTTLDVPESLLRQVKAHAALRGQSMRDYFIEAVGERLLFERKKLEKARGWRAVFGKAPKGSTAKAQQVMDREFEQINPDDWR